MDYGLARLVFGSPIFVPITELEYFDIRQRREILLEALFIEEKFDLVVDNYLEFETDLLNSCAREMVRGVQNWATFQEERNQINRRVVNLLSACRLYLDHTRHHLGNIGDSATAITEIIKTSISAQYDGSLGYRVMDALRNYVQHRGYPIHSVTFNASWNDDRSKLIYAITPYLIIARLEEDGKFKSSVLEELKQQGDKVDIKPMIREYIDGLGKIHNEIRRQLKCLVDESDKTIRDAIELYRKDYPTDDSVVGLAAVKRNDRTYSEPPRIYRRQFSFESGSLA
jgi:hypothetical protein